jgi:hypothetical protein
VSSADFFIPPPPYTATDVEYTGRMTIDGSSHTVTIGTPNKVGMVIFEGVGGQQASLGVNSITMSTNSDIYVYNPDGSTLTSWVQLNTSTNFHMTLPTTGTYTILIDPDATSTGSVTLTLSSEVNAGTIVVDGASVTATIGRVGQRARMTFGGTAGQVVSLGVNSTTLSTNSDIFVYNPDGSTLASSFQLTTGTNFHMTLAATGTYTILIDPDQISTGSVTLTLSSEVNAGTIVINGAAAPLTISRVGQRGYVTFSGNQSQQATVRITGNTMGQVTVRLLKPDGTQLTSTLSSAASFNLATQTLPTTGTYTIQADPSGVNTGSMNISVTSP